MGVALADKIMIIKEEEFDVQKVQRGGSCFFRAVSAAMNNLNDSLHIQLRYKACDEMANNSKDYEVLLSTEDLQKETILDRSKRMRNQGEFAEHLEVKAVAEITGRSFCIYDVDENCLLNIIQKEDDGRSIIYLRLTNGRHPDMAHYDLLLPSTQVVNSVAEPLI